MELIKDFFKELDRLWRPAPAEKIPLQIIGSAALMRWPRKKTGDEEGEFTTETQRGRSSEEDGKLDGEAA